jgi:hypothetical protein
MLPPERRLRLRLLHALVTLLVTANLFPNLFPLENKKAAASRFCERDALV